MDPSSFLLGALAVSVKGLGIGAIGFGLAWWRARIRIRQLEARRQVDPEELEDRLDRLEASLGSVAAQLERLSAEPGGLQPRLPPPPPSASG